MLSSLRLETQPRPQAGGWVPQGSEEVLTLQELDGWMERPGCLKSPGAWWTLMTPLSGGVKVMLVKSSHQSPSRMLIKKRLLPKARGSLTARDSHSGSRETKATASLGLGAEAPTQPVGRLGCYQPRRVPGPPPQSKGLQSCWPFPTDDGRLRSPPFSVVQKVISALGPSSTRTLPPPLPFPELLGLPLTFSGLSASQPTAPGTVMCNLTLSRTAPCPIFHCPPVPGPQAFGSGPSPFGSDPFPLGQIARPPPPLTWAGLGCSGTDDGTLVSDRIYSTHCPGLGIYIWLSPPPPARPKKLLESWKRFRRAPWLPEGKKKKKPKTSPKPPWLPPLCLRALSQPLGPTAPSSGCVGGVVP